MKSRPSTVKKGGPTTSRARGPCTAIVPRPGGSPTPPPAESSSDRIESTASVFAAFGTTRSRSWSTRYVIRSSTIPPSSVRTIPYWAPPTETSQVARDEALQDVERLGAGYLDLAEVRAERLVFVLERRLSQVCVHGNSSGR